MSIRVEYRKEQFEKYFSASKEIEIPLEHYGIRGIGRNIVGNNNLPGKLLSVRDSYGNDIALGIIRKTEYGNLIAYSPIKEHKLISDILSLVI